MSMWLTIETAPKDGTPILAYGKGNRFYVTRDDPDYRVVTATGAFNMAVVAWEDNGYMGYWRSYYDGTGPFDDEPTHWMPLPTPPSPSA